MARFDYECEKGHVIEVEQSIKDEKLTKCPKCQAPTKRLISAPAFHLQGGGWAKDGYGSGGAKKD